MDKTMTCRLCAGLSEPGVSLLDPAQHQLIKFAETNLGLKLSTDRGHPTRVCLLCVQYMKTWRIYKEKCLAVHNMLTKENVATSSPSHIITISSSDPVTSNQPSDSDVIFLKKVHKSQQMRSVTSAKTEKTTVQHTNVMAELSQRSIRFSTSSSKK